MSEQNGPNQETANGNQRESIASASVEPPHAEPDKGSSTAKADESKKPMTRFERVTIGLAFLGTLLAIVSAVLFYDQFREMATQSDMLDIGARQARRDSAIADIKTQAQLKLAGHQVKAAQDSVKAIQRQMRQDQRAWIELDTPDSPKMLVGKNPSINIVVTNLGKTAARNLYVEIIVQPRRRDSPPVISYENGIPRSRSTVGALFPNKSYPVEASVIKSITTEVSEYPVLVKKDIEDWEGELSICWFMAEPNTLMFLGYTT
jgi:hypothetical protein